MPSGPKTAFGYSATDAVESIRSGRSVPPPRPPAVGAAMSPPPLPVATVRGGARAQPVITTPRGLAPPMATPPLAPRGPVPPPFPNAAHGGLVPASAPNAKTIFAQAGAQGPPALASPMAYAQGPALAGAFPAAPAAPHRAGPSLPSRTGPPIIAIPAAQPPPYLASQTADRVTRPVEPWADSLRAWMFLWGLGLIAVFCTPLSVAPTVFQWNVVLQGGGIERLPPLMLAALGVISIILAVAPLSPAGRGGITAVLGLAGLAVPFALAHVPPWQELAPLGGMLVLVPALLMRSEYRDSILPRLLVTAGAAAVLLPFVVPQDGAIPLVLVFKALIDLPGAHKVEPAITLGAITLAVVSLLAWLPAPATGGARLWAWLVILWALFSHAAHVAVADDIVHAVTSAPNATLVAWIAASPGALGSAYLAFVGYGVASVIGKQLE